MTRSARLVLLCLSMLGSLIVVAAPAGANTTFSDGDVFVSTGGSSVQWRGPDGSLIATLTTAQAQPHSTGLDFDPADRLYATGYTSNHVSRFATDGSADGTFGPDYSSHPESIAIDDDGNAYVGLAKGERDVLKLSPAGALIGRYDVATEGSAGADRLDLAADGCTLLYTSAGDAVKRYDVCTGTQLANLATGLPGTVAEEVRALPDGGALVAGTQSIVRVNSAGTVVASFDKLGLDCWVGLSLDDDYEQFWAADACLSQVVKFDVSGAVLDSFSTGSRPGTVGGLTVLGAGWTPPQPGAVADLSVAQSDSPDSASSDNDMLYRVTVSNAGPDGASAVTVEDTVSGGTIRLARGEGWTCDVAGSQAICVLAGTLASGTSAPTLDVVVHTPASAGGYTLQNTAMVGSDAFDPQPVNDSDTESTTVTPAGNGTATAYIPPEGGQVSTDTGPCTDAVDHTCGTAIFPAGPGGIASLVEYPEGIALCATIAGACAGDAIDVIVPDGYLDRANPIVFQLVYDESIAVDGAPALIEKIVNGIPVTILSTPCPDGGPTGLAPCLAGEFRDGNNDKVYEFHFLSGDPKFQGIFPP